MTTHSVQPSLKSSIPRGGGPGMARCGGRHTLIFLTSTPRSSIRLSPSSHRTSVSNVLSRGRGCRKKKYSIGPNEPLFVELGRPMAGSFLVNGPAAGSLCPHRVPPDADSSSPIEDEMTKLRLLQGEITMEIGSQAACGVATSSEQARQVCEG